MLKCERQNYHHSKLPKIGEIRYVAGLRGHDCNGKKCIVIAYPLFDDWQWYGKDHPNMPGRGIHTCYVRLLDTGEIRRIAWQWLIDEFDYNEYRFSYFTCRQLGIK